MEEFSTIEARASFTRNKEVIIGRFKDRLAESSDYIAILNAHLSALPDLIVSPDAVNGALSQDDVNLFATLRAMSIVRGIIYPPAVESYRIQMAELTGVSLHDGFAV